MKDLKYLLGYTLPITALIGFFQLGIWSYLTPLVAFVVIPIMELFLPQDASNLSSDEMKEKKLNPFFDILLYLNVPLVYGIIGYYLWRISEGGLPIFEVVGLTLSVGVAVGSNGINVAHELGHRQKKWERFLGKFLLLPSLYMHFYIDHNFGHHQTVATPDDPSSARYNQSVYAFWLQSVIGEYFNAWRLQKQLLTRGGIGFFNVRNDMLWFAVLQTLYLFIVYLTFGLFVAGMACCVALISILLLQTINYIEHYGLSRKKLPSGRYERAAEIHSWNSNHVVGRMMLYELSRHSDHHYRAHKKYQLLEYHDTSPQLPYGYPTSMVLSLFPPIWFALMNPRIPSEMKP